MESEESKLIRRLERERMQAVKERDELQAAYDRLAATCTQRGRDLDSVNHICDALRLRLSEQRDELVAAEQEKGHLLRRYDELRAKLEVAEAAVAAAIGKAKWQAITNRELNDLRARLEAEVRNKKEFERDWLEACDKQLAAERDAERYRWLRDGQMRDASIWIIGKDEMCLHDEWADAAIDAALKEKP